MRDTVCLQLASNVALVLVFEILNSGFSVLKSLSEKDSSLSSSVSFSIKMSLEVTAT